MTELKSAGEQRDPDVPLLEPGQQIAHYRIERYIDRGGMSEVYLAQNTKLGSDVAIKLLPAKFSNDSRRLKMFEREARMAAHLNHPNIATVHDFFEIDDRHYLVMEFVRGHPLGDLLKDKQPIPLPKLLDIGVQIAQGLAAAHGGNIIHRDLKPGNVMITPEGRVKLLDFGLAKVVQTEGSATSHLGESVLSSSWVIGTVGYMSPEQARGQAVDARSDLFALGVVLYQMATGTAPFHRSTDADTISAILNDEPQSATTLNRDVPLELGQLIERLLAKRPEDRHQSSAAVLADLETLVSLGTSKAQTRSKRVLKVVALLPLVALVVFWLVPSEPSEPHEPVKPDPRIAELIETVEFDVPRARDILRELEWDLGAGHPELTAPQALVRRAVDSALQEGRDHLLSSLAAGDWDAANDSIEDIRKLDDVGTLRQEADALKDEARDLGTGADETRDRIVQHLESNSLDLAWTAITSLDALLFGDQEFKPATDAAREMEARLVATLESRLEELSALEDAGDSDIDRFTEFVALLRRIPSAPEDSSRFAVRLEELERERVLKDLLDDKALAAADSKHLWQVEDSEARSIVGELKNVYAGMHVIDPDCESKRTQGVLRLLGKWKLAGEACDAFAKGQLLDIFLDGTSFSALEQGDVRDAQAWLESYRHALAEAPEAPVVAHATLEDLDAGSLALRFRESASRLLANLEAEIEVSEASAKAKQLIREAQNLVNAILERYKKRQFPTEEQRTELATLRSEEALEDIDLLFGSVDQARENLEEQQGAEKRRAEAYADLRRKLRTAESLAQIEQEFKDLWDGWREEKQYLDAAITHTPEIRFESPAIVDEELLWSRATVNLRLRDYSAAKRDIEDSGRIQTVEGLLLFGMAMFGQERYKKASARFEQAALANERSARAQYWLGTSLKYLASNPVLEEALISGALRHLESVTRLDPGLVDAHYELAWLYVQKGKLEGKPSLSKAIAFANEYLDSDSAFSEDEMLAVFGDIEPAEYPERARKFRCGVYLARAVAYAYLEQYAECIDECSAILRVNDRLAVAYYWRGYAKFKTGEFEAAIIDFDSTIAHAAGDFEVKELAEDYKKRIESKRD